MSNLTADKLLEACERVEAITLPIKAIVITTMISGIYLADHEGDKYILIHPFKWFELKQYLEREKPDESALGSQLFTPYYGISVYEDDDLARKILISVLMKLYAKVD